MCMDCGGRCLLCGEPSVYAIVYPESIGMNMEVYTCAEHHAEVYAKAEMDLMMRRAAPWN